MNKYTLRTEPWLADEIRREHHERRNHRIENLLALVLLLGIIAVIFNLV